MPTQAALTSEPQIESPAPDPSPGPKADDKPRGKTWTDDEVQEHVDRKLKGTGKEIARLQKENEEHRAWRAQQEAKSLTEAEKKAAYIAELEGRARRADELEKAQAARIERMTERNTERVKALPKEAKDTAKKWSDRLEPDAFAEFLDDLERHAQVRDVAHGGRVGPSPEEMDDDQWEQHMKKWGESITKGQKFGEGKKK